MVSQEIEGVWGTDAVWGIDAVLVTAGMILLGTAAGALGTAA